MKNLVQSGGTLARLGARLVCQSADKPLNHDGGQDQQGRANQGSQRPSDVDRQSDSKQRNKRHKITPDTHQKGAPDALNGAGVALHPFDQGARWVVLKK